MSEHKRFKYKENTNTIKVYDNEKEIATFPKDMKTGTSLENIINLMNEINTENVELHIKLDFSMCEAEDFKNKYFQLRNNIADLIKNNKILTLTDIRDLILSHDSVDMVDKIARIIHKHHRESIIKTKSKIATYTLATYNLQEYIGLNDIDICPEVQSFINNSGKEAHKLSMFLFEIDEYDKPYDELTHEIKLYYWNLANEILNG